MSLSEKQISLLKVSNLKIRNLDLHPCLTQLKLILDLNPISGISQEYKILIISIKLILLISLFDFVFNLSNLSLSLKLFYNSLFSFESLLIPNICKAS